MVTVTLLVIVGATHMQRSGHIFGDIIIFQPGTGCDHADLHHHNLTIIEVDTDMGVESISA